MYNNDYWDAVISGWCNHWPNGPDKQHKDWVLQEFTKYVRILRAEQALPTMCLMQLIAQQD